LGRIPPYAPFVAIGTRVAATAAAVITTMALAACGGNGHNRMRATLTDGGCTYQGDTKPATGKFTIEVKNQTRRGANFAFIRLTKGFTAATIRPVLAKETAWVRSLSKAELRNMPEHGKPPLHHPRPNLPQIFDFQGNDGSATDIGAGASRELSGDVRGGTYVVVCRNITQVEGRQLGVWKHYKQYVAAEIDVTGVWPGWDAG
jgi:hypothetical protein